MQDHINGFLDFVYQSRSKKTYAMYKVALQTFIDVVSDGVQLTKETYVKFLRGTTTMNPSTQALYRSAIKGLYLFAADTNPMIDTSFFEQTNKRLALKAGKSLILFNREGIEQIIEYVNTIRNSPTELRDRAFILLLADSGLRVSEACSLRIAHTDLLECQAVVTGKGNKQALVKFSKRASESIRDYLQVREFARSLPLFIRHTKKAAGNIQQVKAGDMWHAIKQRATEAGVDPATIRVHDFRHYFVTVVLASSGNLKLAQELARHDRVETTGRYAHFVGDTHKAYDEIFNK